MAEITVASISTSEGTNSKGKKWKNYVITDEDGNKASGFEHAIRELANVKVGDILEAVIVDDGKFRNFQSIKIIGYVASAKAPAEQPKPEQVQSSTLQQVRQGGRGYSPEERASIETQVAIKASTELWIAGKFTDKDAEVIGLRKWLTAHLSESTSAVKTGQGTAPKPQAVAEQIKIANSPPVVSGAELFPVDEMLQRICEKKKFGSHTTARKWLLDQCGITDEMLEKDPQEAWNTVRAMMHWE